MVASRFRVRSSLFVAMLGLLWPVEVALGADDLDERLARIRAVLTERAQTFRAPGFAVGIVVDDHVVMAEGFGVRSLETQEAVDGDTLFAIGSTTKAMTAALIARQVDARRLDWDDPLRRFVPELELRDETADRNASFRDALAHRTGLAPMDMLWYTGTATFEDMLRAMANAEARAPFRREFHYHNVMYLVAGKAVAAAAEAADWETLLREEILTPLGMDRSGTTVAAMQADSNHAHGYRWDSDQESFERLPMRDLATIAPAGAVNSSAREMTRWIRLQLGRGEFDGNRLISAPRIEEMWAPVVRMGPGVEYALGWMVRSWNDRRLITHTGGIDGFGARVTLLPDQGIGYVVLANTMDSPLLGLADDVLLGGLLLDEVDHDLSDDDRTRWTEYLGRYRFEVLGVDCTVREIDGRLAIDVPGQMAFELHPPDEEGRRRFRGFEDIAIRFDRDAAGRVHQLTLFQQGMTFELPRADVPIIPEIDEADVAWTLGRFRHEAGLTVRMLVRNGRMAIDIPGETVYDLRQPDEEGRWIFRMTDRFWVRLEEPSARAESIELMSSGGLIRLDRVEEAAADAIPTVREVMENVHAGWGTEAYEALFNMRLVYDVEFVNQGIRGTQRVVLAGYDRIQVRLDVPPFGWAHSAALGRFAWSQSAWNRYRQIRGPEHRQFMMQHPFAMLADWSWIAEAVEVRGTSRIDEETTAIEVRFLPAGLPPRTVLFDERTALPIRATHAEITEQGTTQRTETRFEGWRRVEGVAVPELVTIEHEALGRIRMTLRETFANEEFEVDPFVLLEPLDSDGVWPPPVPADGSQPATGP